MSDRSSNCLLCGKEYEVCKLCPRTRLYTPWRLDFDEPRHFQIYAIVQDVRSNTVTDSEAKEQLDRLNVTVEEIKTFVPSVQATLLPVVGAKSVKIEQKVSEPEIVEEKPPQREKGKIGAFKGRNKK